jgi:hypothetical protein
VQPTTGSMSLVAPGGIGSGWCEVALGVFKSVYQALLSFRTCTMGGPGIYPRRGSFVVE